MPKPNGHAYPLKNVPLALWRRAQAKAGNLVPALSMRQVLIMLLDQWVNAPPPTDEEVTF